NPVLTATATGLMNGDTLSSIGVSPVFGTTATISSPVGSYPITVTGPVASSTNYAISYVDGTLGVDPAPVTVTAESTSKVYGAAVPALTATSTGLVSPDTLSSIGVTLSLSTTATASSAVTTYPITVSGTPATSSNYTISYVDGTLTVTPASLTVTANDTSKQYGAANPTFTVSYGSFVNGDTPSDLGGTLTFTAPITGSDVGSYTGQIIPSGLTSTNYTIAFINGTLDVTPAPTSIAATASLEPSTAGDTDTLSTTVTTAVAAGLDPNNEGTVTFSENGIELCTTPTLTGNSASCPHAFSAGNHAITAT